MAKAAPALQRPIAASGRFRRARPSSEDQTLDFFLFSARKHWWTALCSLSTEATRRLPGALHAMTISLARPNFLGFERATCFPAFTAA